MIFLRRICDSAIIAIFLSSAFSTCNSYAASKENKIVLPSILKADKIDSDQINNLINAVGNVELRRENSVVYANEIKYDKNGGWVQAIGNIRIKNIEVGNVVATKAEIKDDFSSGTFFDSTMVLLDGSYMTSNQIDRVSPEITVFNSSIFSICPNPEIGSNNSLAGKEKDLISIKSEKITINRTKQNFKVKNAVVRLYDFPVFYTPYLKSALPSKERESGFLAPSYIQNKFGLGFQTPYYFNIAPNKDSTLTPYINPNNDLYIIKNEFRHLTSYGSYKIIPEIANNKIIYSNDATTISRSRSPYRWNLQGDGLFDFTNNTGLDFTVNNVYDRNYLRDYHNNYAGYTMSKINADYIYQRDYFSVKTMRFQELENPLTEKASPIILPMIDSHIETKPLGAGEKFALTSNTIAITRTDGLQYRRATVIPEMNLPLNLKGNLFTLNTKIQTDFYSLENSFKGNNAVNNNFNSTAFNNKPEVSLNWSLPLIKRLKNNSILIEPMANIVSSTFKKSANGFPNEDSNNSELTVSNLFVSDRIAGFDRNESGTRTSYGFRTSFFNQYGGEYGLTLGQSFRFKDQAQDVSIRGFNDNNKSNIIGLASYKLKKLFYISYAFQLNESNYQNEVNEINASLTLDRLTFTSNYLLLLSNSQNLLKKEQLSFSSKFKFTTKTSASLSATKDMVTGRVLTRAIAFNYEGCCTLFSLFLTQSNQSNLIKPSNSISFSLSFKNL
ncbi:MAG: LPS assembly protein LptD [Rickettsiales bacterium]|nr:LPS assembly protein LptD [Rickettsiales bacterium]